MLSYQSLHRHREPRLILFTRGSYVERSPGQFARFEAGEFVVRPAWFAHDGCDAGTGAAYRQLTVSAGVWRDFLGTHGWQARRGRLAEALQADEALLTNCETRPLDGENAADSLAVIARDLRGPGQVQLAEHAETHGYSPWQLSRAFTAVYGLPPQRYRQEARLQAALKLLAESALSLAGIAAETGFADQSHLSRSIRAATGQTPTALRRALAID